MGTWYILKKVVSIAVRQVPADGGGETVDRDWTFFGLAVKSSAMPERRDGFWT
jgi:hypothetical protein